MKSKITVLALSLMATNAVAQKVVEAEEMATSKPKAEIYKFVEQMPEPTVDIAQFLTENMVYPDTARKADVQGRVNVHFVVDTFGRVTDVKTIGNQRLGFGLEEEAVRVVKLMPNWKPGRQEGKAVKVFYTLPIMFRLEDDEKK